MLKEKVLNTPKHLSMDEQITLLQQSKKPIYIFGGLGSMSLGAVIAKYLTKKQITFEGFLANANFIDTKTHMNKPVFAIENTQIDKEANIIIGISKWKIAKDELTKFGYKNIFLFDSFSEDVLERISLDYFLTHYKDFFATYSTLGDKLSQESMIAYLQGKIFNNFDGLARTYAGNFTRGGGGDILQ